LRHKLKATVESTPPETKKKIFRPAATCRISSSNPLSLGAGTPVLHTSSDAKEEVRQNLHAVLGMDDFGVELDAIELAADIRHGGDRAGLGGAENLEARRRGSDRVAVAHPNGKTA
jgi:hypothetical protein